MQSVSDKYFAVSDRFREREYRIFVKVKNAEKGTEMEDRVKRLGGGS